MGKSSFLYLLLLILLPLASAVLIGGPSVIQASVTNNITTTTYNVNGSNINASTTDCGLGFFVQAYNNVTGIFTCVADSGGGSGSTVTYLNSSNQSGYSVLEVGRSGLSSLFQAIPDSGSGSSDGNNYTNYINITNGTSSNNQNIVRLGRIGLSELSTAIQDLATNTSYSLKSETYNKTDVNLNITSANTSMKGYVDAQNLVFNASNNNYLLANNNSVVNWVTNTFATITSLLDYVKWTDLWGQVYNETEINNMNTSNNNYILATNSTMRDYVLFVNTTNGAGSGSYNDAWINQTFYNKTDVNLNISINNVSVNNYINTLNSTGLIQNWNISGWIYNWNASGLIKTWATITDLLPYALKADYYNKTDVNLNITSANTSQTGYNDAQNLLFNSSNNNYILANNNSVNNNIATKLPLAGGVMTGSVNMSANTNITLTNGKLFNGSNTAYIYHNGTGWVIKG